MQLASKDLLPVAVACGLFAVWVPVLAGEREGGGLGLPAARRHCLLPVCLSPVCLVPCAWCLLCVQAGFLELLAGEGQEAWGAAERALAPVLRSKADLAVEATAVAKARGARGRQAGWLAG